MRGVGRWQHWVWWFVLAGPLSVGGQDLELNRGAVGTYLRLKELQTSGRVLMVVAHPDDEDGAALAYCARGLGARTMLFSITRGEGGANLISSHFFNELGALRTLEHAKAASYYGNDLFYSRAADYGYSKTLAEAMKQWQQGLPILADLVEVIRRERPHVLISRFRGDPRDGHGHHQMAGVVSRLAFAAAADETQFPEQLERGLRPWQVKKLFVRAGSRGQTTPPSDADVVALPVGAYDPMIGRSYAQIARFGLGFQRSQGMSGHDSPPGRRTSSYRLVNRVDGLEHRGTLFSGIDLALARLGSSAAQQEGLAQIEQQLAQLLEAWDPVDNTPTTAALLAVLSQLRELVPGENAAPALRMECDRLEQKLERAIVASAGLELEAWATAAEGADLHHATDQAPLEVHLRLANQAHRNEVEVTTLFVHLPGAAVERGEVPISRLARGDVLETTIEVPTEELPPTKPHWSRQSIALPLYETRGGGGQAPLPRRPFHAEATVKLGGVPVHLAAPVLVHRRHPEYGRVRFPLTVAPAMNVTFPLASGLVPRRARALTLRVNVQSCLGTPASATVGLDLPPGFSSVPQQHALQFVREDQVASVAFRVQMPENVATGAYPISATVSCNGRTYQEGFETVSARDVGRLDVYREATYRLQVADVEIDSALRVGYIPGSGDQVAESLHPLGIHPTILSSTDLASGELSAFDVILVGVRAYAVREDIREHNDRLLAFVQQGGTLIVQYQTPEFDHNFGPYPYQMGRRPEEVSEEDARVTVLAPKHRVFHTPNRIGPLDFDGWFEQRGSKFWRTWDPQYTALLECHDTGQAPQRGGMLIADHGRGVYVYSAYAWYRQLPQGVPGAYRLFANLLSLKQSQR